MYAFLRIDKLLINEHDDDDDDDLFHGWRRSGCTWMGDCLRAGKSSRYEASQL